jgi:3-deoxy-7-phosphoheptulonate synthase
MIVKLNDHASPAAQSAILEALARQDYTTRRVSLPFGDFIVGLGDGAGDTTTLAALESVAWARRGAERAVLAAIDASPTRTEVPLGRTSIGGTALAVIAGPCSVEDRDQIRTCARFVAAYGATALRGGAFKPRSSPYAFQGLGHEALEMLAEAGKTTGLPVVTEVMEPGEVGPMAPLVDCFQIGARSMQNFPLLREVGRAGKPVLLKRGPSSTMKEFLLSAEYVLLEGNPNVILCERGIKTFETATRNTLDLNAVPVLKSQTHLPVVVDPSHGTGRRDAVIPMARAAVAAGADGLIVEVHPDPARALSDGDQSLTLAQFRTLVEEIRPVAEAVGRRVEATPVPNFGEPRTSGRRRGTGWGAGD